MNLIRMHIGATRSAEKAIRAIIKKLGASKVTLTHEGKIDYFEFESQPSRSVWKGSKYCARPKARRPPVASCSSSWMRWPASPRGETLPRR